MSQRKVEFLWVNTPRALDYFISNLRGYFPIALDTEADSLHHYRESVCLIQVTHDSRHFLIDPLDTFPLNELWPPTSRHTWILHGADFDLRRVADRIVRGLAGRGLQGPFDLVGHSLGAMVAATLAVRRPRRVRRLILVAPAGLLATVLGYGVAIILAASAGCGSLVPKRVIGVP